MRVLIEGENLGDYLAKCHEALRTGIRAQFDTRLHGRGYPGQWRWRPIRTYAELVQRLFPDAPPDLLLVACEFPNNARAFRLRGLAEAKVATAFVLADWWVIDEHHHDAFTELVERNRVHLVLSLFPQPRQRWSASSIANRMAWLPPCFDPALFNDWRMPKRYDVGFLADGTANPNLAFYPERAAIHRSLLSRGDLRYLWAKHPGWRRHSVRHPLVGRNFSRAINSCRIFVTTGGIHRNAQPKMFEALASRTLLMSDEPEGAMTLGFIDGETYVRITPEDVLDKVDYYLARPELCERIAENGYRLAMSRHSCYARALDLRRLVRPNPADPPLVGFTTSGPQAS